MSPLLGPLIDRNRGARRLMVVSSAVGQVVLCPLMATHLHSLLLFPLAFLVLVCQKLYLVTKGALVPEMAALDGSDSESEQAGYATLNARLTLLGTLAGFVASIPAVSSTRSSAPRPSSSSPPLCSWVPRWRAPGCPC